MIKTLKKSSTLYAVFFLLLPLVSSRYLPVPFEGAKTYFLFGFIFILFVINAPRLFKEIRIGSIHKFALIFLLWATISSLFGADFQKSLFGNYYRLDGLLTLCSFILLSIFTFNLVKWKDTKQIFLAIAIGLLFSSFGNKNFLAGYLLVTLPIVSATLLNKKLKIIYLIFITFFMIYLNSVGGLLGVLLFIFLKLLFSISSKKIFKKLVIIFGIMFLVAGVTYIISRPDLPVQTRGRERILRRGVMATEKRLVTGWGYANVDYAITSVDWPIRVYKDVYVDKAHSHLLEALVTTGVVGFALYFLFLLKAFNKLTNLAYKNKKYFPILAVFILFVFHSQTNVIPVSEEIVFWFSLGLVD